MTDLFNRTREYVAQSFQNAEGPMRHFDRTVYWLRQLRPNADEALLIAAIGHDLERAYRGKSEGFNKGDIPFTDPDFLQHHQQRGAEILADFLSIQTANKQLIERVKHLVGKHEVGGDRDQSLLMDADSISFLENQAQAFVAKLPTHGYQKVREKIDWMYNRIDGKKAQTLAKPFYEKMIREIDDK